MHAEDDWFIPHHASRQLYEISKQRPSHFPPVQYLEFEKEYGFGHLLIYQNQKIYPIIKYVSMFMHFIFIYFHLMFKIFSRKFIEK